MTAVTVPRSLHLPPRYVEIVLDILRRYLPQAEVWAYGSRVNGDHYDASDLDLVARQPDDLTRRQPDLDEVAAAFSDSDLPILVQLVDWARIPPAFREEIEAGYVVLQPADRASAAPTDAGSHVLAPTLQRGSVGGPLQRPVSTYRSAPPDRRDAGASPLAPTLERGSQKSSASRAEDAKQSFASRVPERSLGTSTNDWMTITLEHAGITLLDCVHKTPAEAPDGVYRYVAIPQMAGGRLDFTTARRITESDFLEWTRKAKPQAHDVVLSRRCNPGETSYVAPGENFALGQNLVLLRADGNSVYPPYLRWLLRGPQWWEQARKYVNVGAVFESLKCRDIPKFKLQIPPLQQQCAIAGILSALDDKIEQNRQTAQALERLARAIFRAWFVDFEPVKAKAAGATSFPSMPHPVFAGLSASLIDSEVAAIPEGWELKPIAAIATFLNGLALQKYPPRGDGKDLPVIKIAELRKGSADKADWANGDVPEQYLINDRDLIFSWSGTLEAELWFGGKGALNQHLFKVTSSQYPSWFCLLWIREHLPWFRAVAASKATTMGHIKRGHLQEARVVIPSLEILHAADRVIGPLYEQHAQVMVESRTLARLRDYLLPKLLSGEVRVQALGESHGRS